MTRRPPSTFGRARRGFSLVEAVTAMAVIGAVSMVASTLLFTSIQSYRDAAVRAQLQGEISTALDRITEALRTIPRDATAGVVAPQVSAVTTSSISFRGNWSLSLSGTQLLLVENGGTAHPLLNDVTAFAVAAYDESNAAVTLPAAGAATQPVRRLQVQITTSRSTIISTMRTRVFIRSTMAGAAVG
jgi:prepilin-type N-terminal cleavage/methylation domain-containing protein